MASENMVAQVRTGMDVHTADGQPLGKVAQVWIGTDPTASSPRCDDERCSRIEVHRGRLLARRLRLANAQIQALATQDVFGRVARQLVAFAEEYGQLTIDGTTITSLRLTQSDLAALVGASRVRVNQVLSFYQQRQFIVVHPNHHITVQNIDALRQRCQ